MGNCTSRVGFRALRMDDASHENMMMMKKKKKKKKKKKMMMMMMMMMMTMKTKMKMMKMKMKMIGGIRPWGGRTFAART